MTNLMNGLASQNRGLKESAAFMLGEEKATRAVVPLMQMLRGGEEESSRIVAALSLCRIGDPRGVYAVKQAAKFDESERVRTLCAWFYNQYVQPGSFEFVAVTAGCACGIRQPLIRVGPSARMAPLLPGAIRVRPVHCVPVRPLEHPVPE